MKSKIKSYVIGFVFMHLLDKNKPEPHRLITGLCFIVIGVSLTKFALVFDSIIVHGLADAVGYLLHGFGTIPFIDIFLLNKNN